jgi:hypothetical protein
VSARRPALRDFGHEPPPAVLDLLRALANGTPPSAAAVELIGQAARGDADRGVLRLLPMLHDHPAVRSLPKPVQESVRLSHFRTGARFVVLDSAARRLCAAMAREDIPLLFLKGLALASGVYASPAHRPMGDLDLAVPHDRYARAVDVLGATGFSLVVREKTNDTLVAGVSAHAFPFRNDELRTSLDLHYNILNCSLWPDADDRFWQEAVPLGQPGLEPALTLAPEHHVFHACVHGYSRSLLQLSIRWMIDAHLVLVKAGDHFRWELVEQEAQRHRCGPLVAAALGYIATHLGSPVPAKSLDRMAAQPMPPFDVAYFRDRAAFHDRGGLWLRLRIAWNSCQRQAGRRFLTPWPFARLMIRRWGATSPLRLVRSVAEHLRERGYVAAKRRAAVSAKASDEPRP